MHGLPLCMPGGQNKACSAGNARCACADSSVLLWQCHVLAKRQVLGRMLQIVLHVPALVMHKLGDGLTKDRVSNPVQTPGVHRLKAALYLVLALGTGVEARQPLRNTMVDAPVIAGLEEQELVFVTATPVASVESVLTLQKQCASHRCVVLLCQHQQQGIVHVFAQLQEEVQVQVAAATTHPVGTGIEAVEAAPKLRGDGLAAQMPEADARFGHARALIAKVLAFA